MGHFVSHNCCGICLSSPEAVGNFDGSNLTLFYCDDDSTLLRNTTTRSFGYDRPCPWPKALHHVLGHDLTWPLEKKGRLRPKAR